MRKLVHTRLRETVMRVVRVQEDAGAGGFVICEQPRDLAVQLAHIDPDAELQIKDRHNIGHGARSEPKPVAQFLRILLGLRPDFTGKDGALQRVVAGPADTQRVFEFNFGADEIVEQAHRLFHRAIPAFRKFAEAGHHIEMYGFPPEDGVGRGTIGGRELLQFVHLDTAPTLLDRDNGGSRRSYQRRGVGLRELRAFPSEANAFPDFGIRQTVSVSGH